MSTKTKNEGKEKQQKMAKYYKDNHGTGMAFLFVWRRWLQPILYGGGAAVVLWGAMLKLTHGEWCGNPNGWLMTGLITEAFIFLVSILDIFELPELPTNNSVPRVMGQNNATPTNANFSSNGTAMEDCIGSLDKTMQKSQRLNSQMDELSDVYSGMLDAMRGKQSR